MKIMPREAVRAKKNSNNKNVPTVLGRRKDTTTLSQANENGGRTALRTATIKKVIEDFSFFIISLRDKNVRSINIFREAITFDRRHRRCFGESRSSGGELPVTGQALPSRSTSVYIHIYIWSLSSASTPVSVYIHVCVCVCIWFFP